MSAQHGHGGRFTVRRNKGVWNVARNDGQRVMYSEVKESAALAAKRLSAGVPVVSPVAYLESSLRVYGLIFPSRLAFYDHTYLVGGNGLDWINGGLAPCDATPISPEGEGHIVRGMMRHDARTSAMSKEIAELLGESSDTVEARSSWDLYVAGEWPDVAAKPHELYPASEEYSAMGELLRAETRDVEPAWLDDARAAMRLLLRHGQGRRGTMKMLCAWSKRLAARHGGRWAP